MSNVVDIAMYLEYKKGFNAVYSGHIQAEVLNLQLGALPVFIPRHLQVYVNEEQLSKLTDGVLEDLFKPWTTNTSFNFRVKYRQKTSLEVWLYTEGHKDIITIEFKRMTKNIIIEEGVFKNGTLKILDQQQYLGKVLTTMLKGHVLYLEDTLLFNYLISLYSGIKNTDIQKYIPASYRGKEINNPYYINRTSYAQSYLVTKYGEQKANEIKEQVAKFTQHINEPVKAIWQRNNWSTL